MITSCSKKGKKKKKVRSPKELHRETWDSTRGKKEDPKASLPNHLTGGGRRKKQYWLDATRLIIDNKANKGNP